jgi:Bacterial Ig domain
MAINRTVRVAACSAATAVVAMTLVQAPVGAATADMAAPQTRITSPPDSSSFPPGARVVVQGSSTDDIGVVTVETRLMDLATELFWDGSGWVNRDVWLPVSIATPGATSLTWSTDVPAVYGGFYLWARSTDAATKIGASARILFTTEADYPPSTVVVTPRHGATVASPVLVRGSATDNVGVSAVRVAIRDRSTLRWWTGTDWGAFTALAATVASPGSASTTWEISWTPPQPGSYLVQARAVDTAGTADPTPVNRYVESR